MNNMRIFTLAEAEAMLPQIRDELLAMREHKRQLDAIREDIAALARRATGNGHARATGGAEQERLRAQSLVDMLNEGLARMSALGVEVKGVDEGLVDWPHEREGRVVYLCWRLGEGSIAWWHEIEAGFAGRNPL
jgi:hypothetical protein